MNKSSMKSVLCYIRNTVIILAVLAASVGLVIHSCKGLVTIEKNFTGPWVKIHWTYYEKKQLFIDFSQAHSLTSDEINLRKRVDKDITIVRIKPSWLNRYVEQIFFKGSPVY
jgi:hypothetical protein